MPTWGDVYKYFTYAFRPSPLEQEKGRKSAQPVGVTQPDSIPDIRGGNDGFWGGGKGTMRVSNDFVDLSSVSNRQARYKEYERLRAVAEIETAMTVFADEMCVAGNTKVSTPFGQITIQELTEKKPYGERFLVYCYDFSKNDYALGWAHSPRLVKTAPTVKIALDDGTSFTTTADHRVLLRTGKWIMAGELKTHDELMPFYRQPANQRLTKLRNNQFARIFTFNDGWQHERQFIDEWKLNRKLPKYEKIGKVIRMIQQNLSANQICQLMEVTWKPVKQWLKNEGFSYDEILELSQKSDRRIVKGVFPGETIPVYDLSVERHENFCGESIVFHNCQVGENNRLYEIKCDDDEVKEEAEFLLNEVLEVDDWLWSEAKNLCLYGDRFWEIVISEEEPKAGIVKIVSLPPDSVYRIETTKGKLLEFQQSKEGPDYQSLARVEVTKATEAELAQATAIRFAPEQIIHCRIGDDRKTFYPYGVSLVEAARSPAHQLRLMEDAMVVYRLCRAPERRVFYIDVGQLPPFKAEAFIERMKDQFRKKKVHTNANGGKGASGVEERWHAPAADEDYWLPIRPNSGTKIETLPGACLALNTEIPLLDGRKLPLSEIITEVESGSKLWTYSINPKTGETVPGRISWAGITRRNTQTVRVTFDNGESVICTPDHNFPTQNKGKVQAQNLVAGDSLFPFTTRLEKLSSGWKAKYEQVYDSFSRKWKFTHRMVINGIKDTSFCQNMVYCEEYKNNDKSVIHHIDYNHFNNSPENLAWMNWDDHKSLHRDNQETTIVWIDKLWNFFLESIKSGYSAEQALKQINENQDILTDFAKANTANYRKGFRFKGKLTMFYIKQMVRAKGYTDARHLKREAANYNHKVVSVEWLPDLIDTGTITIDGDELVHDHHTFALSRCGVYTYNSNLGEIDDALYFRNKLFIALNFPKNYAAQEADSQQTRITLSSTDVKFAKLIERLQKSIAKGLREVVIRHLRLRGFPEKKWNNLQIKMTPPSDWHEISRNEVTEARYNRAAAMKGAQLMSDYDILVDILRFDADKAKDYVARMKQQKLEDLKLQVMGQNPQLLGLGQPPTDEKEIGTDANGPNSNPGPQPDPNTGGEPPDTEKPPGNDDNEQSPNNGPGGPEGGPLPEPTDEDINKYNLGIKNYNKEIDEEEVDDAELGD